MGDIKSNEKVEYGSAALNDARVTKRTIVNRAKIRQSSNVAIGRFKNTSKTTDTNESPTQQVEVPTTVETPHETDGVKGK